MKSCVNIKCRRQIPDGAQHCPYCGQKQVGRPRASTIIFGGIAAIAILIILLLTRPEPVPNAPTPVPSTISYPSSDINTSTASTNPSSSPPTPAVVITASNEVTSQVMQVPLLDEYSLAFASDRSGEFEIYLMNPEDGAWKKLNRPEGYDVAIWPSFCGNEVSAELQDTHGMKVQWIYLLNPVSDNTTALHTSDNPRALGVPRCSPDGQLLSYSENSNSKWLMQVDTFPQAKNTLTIANYPIIGYASWFRNSRDLLYMTYLAGTFRIRKIQGLDPVQTSDISPSRTQEGNEITQWEFPAISPDGTQMAFLCEFGGEDWLCVTNFVTGITEALQRIQYVKTLWDQWDIISAGTPAWSFDGNWIYFSSGDDGKWDIYRVHADGSGKENLTIDWPSNQVMPSTR